ncbi:MAG: KH domain-containing protein [Candidatus Sericytochromatia bacterium]|nr:KH domain-containing protein [Candidatus Sericytochromatia bacterium]
MQNVAEVLLKAIASKPEAVGIEVAEDGVRTTLTVTVDEDDVPRMIGRKGRTINAVRTIVKAAGLKSSRQVSLELIAPDLQSSDH